MNKRIIIICSLVFGFYSSTSCAFVVIDICSITPIGDIEQVAVDICTDRCLVMDDPLEDEPYTVIINDGITYFDCSFKYDKLKNYHFIGIGNVEYIIERK